MKKHIWREIGIPALVVFVSFSTYGAEPGSAIGAIPHCAHTFGTVVLSEAGTDPWWKKYDFAPPTVLINKIVRLSGCFRIVSSNDARDFVLVPDIGRHTVAGENATAVQEEISPVDADVHLTLVNTRSPGAEIVTSGHGENSALRFGPGGGLEIFSRTQADDTGYAHSIIGQNVALGFSRAYADLIQKMSSANTDRL